MDVAAELAAVDQRVRSRIDRNARDALARINDATPGELLAGDRKTPWVEAGEALGEFCRIYVETMSTFLEAFKRGFGGAS